MPESEERDHSVSRRQRWKDCEAGVVRRFEVYSLWFFVKVAKYKALAMPLAFSYTVCILFGLPLFEFPALCIFPVFPKIQKILHLHDEICGKEAHQGSHTRPV